MLAWGVWLGLWGDASGSPSAWEAALGYPPHPCHQSPTHEQWGSGVPSGHPGPTLQLIAHPLGHSHNCQGSGGRPREPTPSPCPLMGPRLSPISSPSLLTSAGSLAQPQPLHRVPCSPVDTCPHRVASLPLFSVSSGASGNRGGHRCRVCAVLAPQISAGEQLYEEPSSAGWCSHWGYVSPPPTPGSGWETRSRTELRAPLSRA